MIESVRVLTREFADDPFVFPEVPSWLQAAIGLKKIVPEFRSEDYWYYVVQTANGPVDATPGDLILNFDGQLGVQKEESVVFQDDDLVSELKRRTDVFVKDNFKTPTVQDWLIVNSAMTIGALAAKELEMAEMLRS